MTLNVDPVSGRLGEVTVYDERDPFQNAWVANPDGVINLRGPILLNSGLYDFHVEILEIDNDRNLFIPDKAPKFDSTVPLYYEYQRIHLTEESKELEYTLYQLLSDFLGRDISFFTILTRSSTSSFDNSLG